MLRAELRRRGGAMGKPPLGGNGAASAVVEEPPAGGNRGARMQPRRRLSGTIGHDMRLLTSDDIQDILVSMGVLEHDGCKMVNGFFSWMSGSSHAASEEWEGHNLRTKLPQLLNYAFWSLSGAWQAQESTSATVVGTALAASVRAAMNDYMAQALRGEFVKCINERGNLGIHVDWATNEVEEVDKGSPADRQGVQKGWRFKSIAVGDIMEEATEIAMIKAMTSEPFQAYEVLFTSQREQEGILRVQMALEDAMYAVSREYGSDAAKHANVIDAVYFNQALHTAFAFYYKHPLYMCKQWFLVRLFWCQLVLSLYSWYPWLDAQSCRAYSSQARLLRHSVHRHGLTGFAITFILIYVSFSLLALPFGTDLFLFDKDLRDEGVVAFVVFFVHMVFGGL